MNIEQRERENRANVPMVDGLGFDNTQQVEQPLWSCGWPWLEAFLEDGCLHTGAEEGPVEEKK